MRLFALFSFYIMNRWLVLVVAELCFFIFYFIFSSTMLDYIYSVFLVN